MRATRLRLQVDEGTTCEFPRHVEVFDAGVRKMNDGRLETWVSIESYALGSARHMDLPADSLAALTAALLFFIGDHRERSFRDRLIALLASK